MQPSNISEQNGSPTTSSSQSTDLPIVTGGPRLASNCIGTASDFFDPEFDWDKAMEDFRTVDLTLLESIWSSLEESSHSPTQPITTFESEGGARHLHDEPLWDECDDHLLQRDESAYAVNVSTYEPNLYVSPPNFSHPVDVSNAHADDVHVPPSNFPNLPWTNDIQDRLAPAHIPWQWAVNPLQGRQPLHPVPLPNHPDPMAPPPAKRQKVYHVPTLAPEPEAGPSTAYTPPATIASETGRRRRVVIKERDNANWLPRNPPTPFQCGDNITPNCPDEFYDIRDFEFHIREVHHVPAARSGTDATRIIAAEDRD
ncbi:hypothetical protein CVT24_003300 [Panaeolus cyanescens]|uniref:Uncharacterized protein n=1 Tax=Panaeolus cyanescens TaxID=181874 RepID=A0A409YRC3_9AGAR|nr:hypothetical protein CVT24_003300 [Panaeolus cyanescens]